MTLNERQSGDPEDRTLTRRTPAGGVHSMISEVGKDKALEIYVSHPSAWPSDVGVWDVPLGLTDCPSGISSNASWLAWKERLLSRSAAYPENQGLKIMIQRVDEVLAWRAAIPPHWKWWA
jgi:hypothetical protein